MIISIASGKGGTGKTTVATSLALSVESAVQFLDCDVEEPNAHIFIKPDIENTQAVFISVPEIDESKCDYCGKCQEVCVYNAIAVIPPAEKPGREGKTLVFPELCHGCGACSYFCPKGAIKEVDRQIGVVEKGKKGELEFVHGRLNIGEPMAPPLVRAVRRHVDRKKTVIIDAPPGTSCPVITSIKDTDYCVLVTEPTPFGLYDLTLAVEVLRKLGIPFGVIINRDGLGDDKTDKYCREENIPVLMRIPFSREIAVAYSRGVTIVEAFPDYGDKFIKIFKDIKRNERISGNKR
jgi:MinD superfamily P-loop ATPase